MTTEDDFQAALDADPDDWQTRLVFADWLEERGDPRANGYRALGRGCRRPVVPARDPYAAPGYWCLLPRKFTTGYEKAQFAELPADWLTLIPRPADQGSGAWWRTFATRRTAEDAAALAFAGLSPEPRAEFLAAVPAEPPEPAPKKRTRRRKPDA